MMEDLFIFILSIVLFPPVIMTLFRLSRKYGTEVVYAFLGFLVPVITWISLSPDIIVNGLRLEFFSFSLLPALLMIVFLFYLCYGISSAKKAVFSILIVFIGTAFILTIFLFVDIAYSSQTNIFSLINTYFVNLIAVVSFLVCIFVAIYIIVFVFEYSMDRTTSNDPMIPIFLAFTTGTVSNGILWSILYRSLLFITALRYTGISEIFHGLGTYVTSSFISGLIFSAFIYSHIRYQR